MTNKVAEKVTAKILGRFLLLFFALTLEVIVLFSLLSKSSSQLSVNEVTEICLLALLICAAFFIAHKMLPSADLLLFVIPVLLNCIGLVQIFRIDIESEKVFDDYRFAVNSQLLFTFVGIILMLTTIYLMRDHRKLRRYIYTSMLLGIICIILPLVPGLGVEANGAGVWIQLGPLGTAQPAEFTKLFLAIFFAGYLTINRERLQSAGKRILGFQLPRLKDAGPILVVWLISLAVLIVQHDLGTSLLFFGMFIAMLYIATGKISWTIIGLLMFSAGAFLASKIFSHVALRIEAWQDPFNPDIYNRLFGGSGQIVQGFFAIANGGLFGQGIDGGYPLFTPFSNSDFIYSSLGEEFGLTGLMAVLVLYLLLIERAISISLNTKDAFGKLLSVGIAFSIVLQIFVVIGGVTGIIPLTGLTLPFIARGGSSLIANYLIVAVLLIISNSRSIAQGEKLSWTPLQHNLPVAKLNSLSSGTTKGVTTHG